MADQADLSGVWKATLDELADEISSPQQRAYLQLTKLRAIVEDTALLAVPDAFTRDVIESRLRPAITEALSRRLNRPIQVAVTVKPPEDGTGLPGTVYGTPVESATCSSASQWSWCWWLVTIRDSLGAYRSISSSRISASLAASMSSVSPVWEHVTR